MKSTGFVILLLNLTVCVCSVSARPPEHRAFAVDSKVVLLVEIAGSGAALVWKFRHDIDGLALVLGTDAELQALRRPIVDLVRVLPPVRGPEAGLRVVVRVDRKRDADIIRGVSTGVKIEATRLRMRAEIPPPCPELDR
jgi:hypothetical protein